MKIREVTVPVVARDKIWKGHGTDLQILSPEALN